ncbi:hypothetical protein RZS08_14915, partial [Arthrospira platensis SPKY1]|nr:hypothetical protein [Arthrospira platensis SPKY1]
GCERQAADQVVVVLGVGRCRGGARGCGGCGGGRYGDFGRGGRRGHGRWHVERSNARLQARLHFFQLLDARQQFHLGDDAAVDRNRELALARLQAGNCGRCSRLSAERWRARGDGLVDYEPILRWAGGAALRAGRWRGRGRP